MIIEKLTLPGGTELENVPADEQILTDLGVPSGDIQALISAASTKEQAAQVRQIVRAEIHQTAGDVKSLLGTTADIAGYMLEKLGRLAVGHTAGQAAFDAVMAEIATDLAPLLAGIEAETICLTHHVKGVAEVITEAGKRATAVAGVLEAHAEP